MFIYQGRRRSSKEMGKGLKERKNSKGNNNKEKKLNIVENNERFPSNKNQEGCF